MGLQGAPLSLCFKPTVESSRLSSLLSAMFRFCALNEKQDSILGLDGEKVMETKARGLVPGVRKCYISERWPLSESPDFSSNKSFVRGWETEVNCSSSMK